MKKNIVLLVACLSTSIGVYAVTDPKVPTGTQSAPEKAIEAQSPVNNDAAAASDLGSGDDVDTFNGGDPANDPDPEADDTPPVKTH